MSSVTDRLLLCGALNCPGVDDNTVNVGLAVALQELGLTQHVCRLRASSLFTSPSSTAEAFAEQLENVVVSTLDELAPLRKFKRRPSKNVTRWLSPAAIDAKRTRRRLERQWRSHQQESDRVAYRRACRSARKLIQASHRDYFLQKLSSASDAKQRWSVAKHLLHFAHTAVCFDDSESRRLCCDFSNFFVDKVLKVIMSLNHTG